MGPPAEASEVIFAEAVDGLFVIGLGDRVTPALQARLKAAGLDLQAARLPTYPRSVWNEAIAITAEEIWANLDRGEAHRRVGLTIIEGFSQTLLGRALATLAKVLGPMRTLNRMRRNFRTGGNYNETRLTAEHDTRVRFWINEPVIHPGYVQGMLEGSLEISGAKNASVKVVGQDAEGTTYLVEWEG